MAFSFFKKKDEERKAAYQPSPSDDGPKEKAGAGGKGGGKPAEPKYDPQADNFQDILKEKNEDGRFGYGYVDPNTGIEVPWYIDMINGGGANAAGSEFVSPFEALQGGLVGVAGQAVSGGLNSAGVAPYGYNQPRRYAQAGMAGYPALEAVPASGGNSTGGLLSTPSDAAVEAPTSAIPIGQGNTTPLSYGEMRPPEAIGINEILLNRNRGFHPTISPLTMPAASVSNPNYATYEGNPVPQMATPSLFGSGVNSTDFTPALDPAMFGSDSTASTDVGRIRMDNLNTVPSEYAGSQLEAQYERYLRAGGQLFFPEFKKGLGG